VSDIYADWDRAEPLSLFDLRGRSALVTGASGTYGRTVSVALAALGCRVMMVSGSEAELADAADAARAVSGGDVTTFVGRPSTPEAVEAIVSATEREHGALDLLVVASGLNEPAPIVDMPYEQWRRVMEANVAGPWLLAKAFGSRLIEQGRRGKLLMVSSVRGRHGNNSGYTAYCTSKGAVDALTRVLATEWGPHGICVNAIAPTVFRSALTSWIFADDEKGKHVRDRNLARIPLGRLGEPEDLVGVSMFLLSRASDFCTGQVVYVDGGYTAA
jgi:NAD(P)-dependent dehydrogenase (short-subunit alcohol dehydrogenase family)